jgi:cell division septation protein DedD
MTTKPLADPAAGPATNKAETPSTAGTHGAERKRIPLASIPVTISVGLLIAALYLGGRIVAARRPERLAPPVVHTPVIPTAPPTAIQSAPQPARSPLPDPPLAKTPETAAESAASTDIATASEQGPPPSADTLPTIQPRAGERYIQVGALDQEATRRFLERLRGEKLDPHVAPASLPNLLRVLIGPFSDIQALNEKKAQLESEGVDTFVREY